MGATRKQKAASKKAAAPLGPEPPLALYARTQAQLAHVLAVSDRQVQRWLAEGAPPAEPERGYELRAWVQWTRSRRAGPDSELIEARRRWKIAQAGLEELRLERERGGMVSRTHHERTLDALCAAFRQAIVRAPAELPPRLAGKPLLVLREIVQAWSDRQIDAVFGPPEDRPSAEGQRSTDPESSSDPALPTRRRGFGSGSTR